MFFLNNKNELKEWREVRNGWGWLGFVSNWYEQQIAWTSYIQFNVILVYGFLWWKLYDGASSGERARRKLMKALYAFPTSHYNVLRLIGTEGLGFQFISLSRSYSIEFCIYYFNCSEFQTVSPLGKGDLFRSGKKISDIAS